MATIKDTPKASELAKLLEHEPPPPEGEVPTDENGVVDPRYELAVMLRRIPNNGVLQVCKSVGIGMATYYKWFPAQDRDAARVRELARIRQMQLLRDQGWTDAAIARHFKTSRERVGRLLGRSGRLGGNGLRTVKWRASHDAIHRVEVMAAEAGASNQEGEYESSIHAMLDMLAQGLLILTAPPRQPGRKLGPDSR